MTASLKELALKHKTDKEGSHFYTRWYEKHLSHLRDEPIRLLEIGVGGYENTLAGGESLRMWKEFFPNAKIFGLDIHDKSSLAEERIQLLQGSQNDAYFLRSIGKKHGPFDIVVDDGSHINSDVIASFLNLFPYVTKTGIYIIEDLQTSYWRNFGGSSKAGASNTSMDFLKRLTDGLNHAEFDFVNYKPSTLETEIECISFVHNMAFVFKGENTESSNFIPPHPRSQFVMGGDS